MQSCRVVPGPQFVEEFFADKFGRLRGIHCHVTGILYWVSVMYPSRVCGSDFYPKLANRFFFDNTPSSAREDVEWPAET